MSVVNVAPAILALSSGTYTVTRYAAGDYVAGKLTAGSTSTLSISASVQPVSGQELQRLPEGERVKDWLYVYTPTELNTREGKKAADKISIDGANYEVATVDDWATEGGFYRALVQRVP